MMEAKGVKVSTGLRFDPKRRCLVALRSVAHNRFLCAEKSGSLVCNRNKRGAWEKFRCVPMGDGKVGLQSDTFKKYVTATKGEMACDKGHCKGHEQFTPVLADDGSFALRSYRGTYLSAQLCGA